MSVDSVKALMDLYDELSKSKLDLKDEIAKFGSTVESERLEAVKKITSKVLITKVEKWQETTETMLTQFRFSPKPNLDFGNRLFYSCLELIFGWGTKHKTNYQETISAIKDVFGKITVEREQKFTHEQRKKIELLKQLLNGIIVHAEGENSQKIGSLAQEHISFTARTARTEVPKASQQPMVALILSTFEKEWIDKLRPFLAVMQTENTSRFGDLHSRFQVILEHFQVVSPITEQKLRAMVMSESSSEGRAVNQKHFEALLEVVEIVKKRLVALEQLKGEIDQIIKLLTQHGELDHCSELLQKFRELHTKVEKFSNSAEDSFNAQLGQLQKQNARLKGSADEVFEHFQDAACDLMRTVYGIKTFVKSSQIETALQPVELLLRSFFTSSLPKQLSSDLLEEYKTSIFLPLVLAKQSKDTLNALLELSLTFSSYLEFVEMLSNIHDIQSAQAQLMVSLQTATLDAGDVEVEIERELKMVEKEEVHLCEFEKSLQTSQTAGNAPVLAELPKVQIALVKLKALLEKCKLAYPVYYKLAECHETIKELSLYIQKDALLQTELAKPVSAPKSSLKVDFSRMTALNQECGAKRAAALIQDDMLFTAWLKRAEEIAEEVSTLKLSFSKIVSKIQADKAVANFKANIAAYTLIKTKLFPQHLVVFSEKLALGELEKACSTHLEKWVTAESAPQSQTVSFADWQTQCQLFSEKLSAIELELQPWAKYRAETEALIERHKAKMIAHLKGVSFVEKAFVVLPEELIVCFSKLADPVTVPASALQGLYAQQAHLIQHINQYQSELLSEELSLVSKTAQIKAKMAGALIKTLGSRRNVIKDDSDEDDESGQATPREVSRVVQSPADRARAQTVVANLLGNRSRQAPRFVFAHRPPARLSKLEAVTFAMTVALKKEGRAQLKIDLPNNFTELKAVNANFNAKLQVVMERFDVFIKKAEAAAAEQQKKLQAEQQSQQQARVAKLILPIAQTQSVASREASISNVGAKVAAFSRS